MAIAATSPRVWLRAVVRTAVVVISLATLLAAPSPAAAQTPLTFFKNYFVTGDYVVRGVSLWRRGISDQAFARIPALGGPDGVPETADIVAAFLYVQTAEKVRGSGIHHAKFAGHDLGPFMAPGSLEPGSGTLAKALGDWNTAPSPCWGTTRPGGRKLVTYRVDALRFLPIDPVSRKQALNVPFDVVIPDGGLVFGDDNEISRETSASNAPRAIGASLVVVYRDTTKPFSGIVLLDGAYTKDRFATMAQTVSGFYQASLSNPQAKMTHLVGDGHPHFSESVSVGSQPVAVNPFVGANGHGWDNTTFQIALPGGASEAVVTVDRHSLTRNNSQSDCLSYSAIVLRTTVEDPDRDGLLSIWETSQSPLTSPNGEVLPNLQAMGADPNVPDIFAQVDYLYTTQAIHYGGPSQPLKPAHTHRPTDAALTMVGDAFANAPTPIRVHFDMGANYQGNPYVIPVEHARGGQGFSETLACPDEATGELQDCPPDQMPGQYPLFPGTVGWKTGFQLLREDVFDFDHARKDIFRYVLFGHFLGLPVESCLNEDGTADFECQATDPNFRVPRTNSGIGDYPGGDVLVTLGAFNNAAGEPIGTDFMQGSTLMHEWGHTLQLQHGGVPQVPREPNCKPNYLSVMNYLFQLRGLPDVNGILRMDYGREPLDAINEGILSESPLGSQLYRTGWYAPFRANANINAATKHCDGSVLTTVEQDELDNGGGMMRVDAPDIAGAIDWNANGVLFESPAPQDINFDGLMNGSDEATPELHATVDDWSHIRLQELGGRRNAGGYYVDTLGRKALGPLSLDVGHGDVGHGDVGHGDVGHGDVGHGDVGHGDVGHGDIGHGDIGRGDLGHGDIGHGDVGHGDIGRGEVGRAGGDLDVGGPNEPPGDMTLDTAKAAEGGSSPPPSGVQACLTVNSDLILIHADATCATGFENPPVAGASGPVNLGWHAPTEGQVALYQVYRFAFTGDFVPPAPEDLPADPIGAVSGTSYTDTTAPAGTQLAYYVKALFPVGDTLVPSNISNFDTVKTPEPPPPPPPPPASIVFVDLGTEAPPSELGDQTMTPFGDDTRANHTDVTAVPSPLDGELVFGSTVSHRQAGSCATGWCTWSHGYTGDVYVAGGTTLTMTLPGGTTAFYFYAEPNTFDLFDFTITTTDGETTTVTVGVAIEGEAGAHGFGFHASGTTISAITVTTTEGASGFAVGEFGIASSSGSPPPPEP